MTKPHHFDYIIVGQGLAGTALAIRLLQLKKKILVVDQPERNTSSQIAAGLFNPITGRKMVKTWMADKLFPALHTHYRAAEALTGQSFFHSMPVYRPFLSVEEQNEWMGKSAEPSFTSYIEKIETSSAFPDVKDDYGGLMLRQCGYLNTTHYIRSVRAWLEKEDAFAIDDLTNENLVITPEGVRYKNYESHRIVFCSGTHTNHWFGWLPIRPLKGEAIRVRASRREEFIINRGVYVVPASDGDWRVGATYNYDDGGPGVTEKSRLELEEKMKELVTFPFTIVGQEWGLRPTTPDRRPILGRHPELQLAWVFNGMGTKGVSLAPYFADVLVRSMENDEPLNKEVDIERYKLLYWTSPR